MGRRSKFDSAFKTKVVLDALKEKETLSELVKKYGVAPKQITDWKKEFLEKSGSVFGEEHSESKELKSLKAENERLLKKVGQLTIEVDFFAEACEAAGLKRK
ncbi:MAG: transposase [Paludibacteraceae bacterium]|nr:transposase [Paludibacteraceae bacterium]